MKEEGVQQYVKFQNPEGYEVVYNLQTGKADLSNKLGTYNKGKWWLSHWWYDMRPHENGEEYLYAGVFYSYNQDGTTVEIINAQTGKPITGAEVEHFATSRADTTPTGIVNLPPEFFSVEQSTTPRVVITPTGTVNLSPAFFSVEQSTTPYSNYSQQRKNNNSALSTPKNSVFGK